jgi:hypothetical protein
MIVATAAHAIEVDDARRGLSRKAGPLQTSSPPIHGLFATSPGRIAQAGNSLRPAIHSSRMESMGVKFPSCRTHPRTRTLSERRGLRACPADASAVDSLPRRTRRPSHTRTSVA